MRGRNPAIAASSDGFNEHGVIRGIAQCIAQTVNGADDAAIKIHKGAIRPKAPADFFPAKNLIRAAEQQPQSLERQFLNLDLHATLAQFARTQVGFEYSKTNCVT